ncbi:MAG: GNAT family N-acetyltransferase [Nitriliruptorales bacterium]|nr:GNAT family N-acetyltransferase [Nitriliruptorales bacterium]
MGHFTIREPRPDDAAALGRIHVRAWQTGYRNGLMPDDYLDGLSVDERAQMWRDAVEAPPRPRRAHLTAADDNDTPVGFILVGPAEGDDGADEGEVYALNVDPDVWGQGAGRALLDAGTDALADAGFTDLVLWVHRDAERSRAFYEHNGWQPDGAERTQDVLGVEVPEVRYRRTVP